MNFRIKNIITFVVVISFCLILIRPLIPGQYNEKVQIVNDHLPHVSLGATHQSHQYIFEQNGQRTNITVIATKGQKFDVFPLITWKFDTNNVSIKYINQNYAVGWNGQSLSSKNQINHSVHEGEPESEKNISKVRIQQKWEEVTVSATEVDQIVRLQLYDSQSNRLLTEHRLVINVKIQFNNILENK